MLWLPPVTTPELTQLSAAVSNVSGLFGSTQKRMSPRADFSVNHPEPLMVSAACLLDTQLPTMSYPAPLGPETVSVPVAGFRTTDIEPVSVSWPGVSRPPDRPTTRSAGSSEEIAFPLVAVRTNTSLPGPPLYVAYPGPPW